jgi:UDP-GlcNAc:undecaprenyl-phosphate GlcNAc-1-phosphate transferase
MSLAFADVPPAISTIVYFACGAGATAIFAFVLIAAARRRLAPVDAPDARRTHSKPTPRVGGVAVWLGFLCCIPLFGLERQAEGPLLAALAIAVVGAGDDWLRDRFPWYLKLAAQASAAAWLAWAAPSPWNLVFAVFLVFAMNAANFFDHADGLLFFGLLPSAFALGSPTGPILLGCLTVFGILNLSGRVFAGDAGSHSLALFVAAYLLRLPSGEDPAGRLAPFETKEIGLLPIAILALLLSLPLLDAAAVIFIRVVRGVPPWRATHDHLADRYRSRFGPRVKAWKAVSIWALSSIAAAVLASLLLQKGGDGAGIVIGSLAIIPGLVAVAVVALGTPSERAGPT